MLVIRRELLEAVIAHARRDHPQEACGVLAGPADADQPLRFIPLANAARSATVYEVDATDRLRLYRELEARAEEPVVIYHSHTASPAYPSDTDVAFAAHFQAHYLLVSTRHPDIEEVRSYRIVDGQVTEEPVQVLDQPASPDALPPHPQPSRAG